MYKILRRLNSVKNISRNYSNSVPKISRLKDGPELKDFLIAGKNLPKYSEGSDVSYLNSLDFYGHDRKVNIFFSTILTLMLNTRNVVHLRSQVCFIFWPVV